MPEEHRLSRESCFLAGLPSGRLGLLLVCSRRSRESVECLSVSRQDLGSASSNVWSGHIFLVLRAATIAVPQNDNSLTLLAEGVLHEWTCYVCIIVYIILGMGLLPHWSSRYSADDLTLD